MLASRMTDAVSPAALLPFPEVYTAMGACRHPLNCHKWTIQYNADGVRPAIRALPRQ